MNYENDIIEMLKSLKVNNIYATEEFEKDITMLVLTNVKKFVRNFYRDIRRKNFEEYNRYERLSLNKPQKELLKGKALYRYEYRENSNLKCIYVIENENTMQKTILLCAFNEDGDKTKGKNSYKDNINRAIRIYLNTIGNWGDKDGNWL